MSILVIKLGALGDVVQALGPFAAIRAHHPREYITLLTTRPYAGFLAKSPYFDSVWIDSRAPWWDLQANLALWWQMRSAGFTRVYDLQTADRSNFYFRMFPKRAKPEWSGIAGGCSHPDPDPDRDHKHTLDRQRGQLRAAGIETVGPPDLSWVEFDASRFDLPERYALLVPGGSAHRPEKRWPAERYAELARALIAAGTIPFLLGAKAEQRLTRKIVEAAPGALDLAGTTGLADVVGLARRATFAIGNDTGPMHLIAAAGAPSLVLFSHASDPALCAPRGERVQVLRRPALAELDVATVLAGLAGISPPGPDR